MATEDDVKHLNIGSNLDLQALVHIAQRESDDVTRAMARAKLEGNFITILERMLREQGD